MSYIISKAHKLPNGVVLYQLNKELVGLSVTCKGITGSGDTLTLWFTNTPSAGDLIIIDSILEAHIPEPPMFNDLTFITITSNYQINNKSINADTTNSNITLTLPKVVKASGAYVGIKKIAAANTLTVVGYSNELINGSSSAVLTVLNSYLLLYCDGAVWTNSGPNDAITTNEQIISITNNKGDIAIDTGGESGLMPLSVGSDGQVLTADSSETLGMKWATVGVSADSTIALVDKTSDPTAPVSGLKAFTNLRVGHRTVGTIDPSGVINELQSALFKRDICFWSAQGNGTTIFLLGFGNTITGNVTTRSVASNNVFTSSRRIGYVSGSNAGSSAGTRHALQQFWRGNQPGLGGFLYVARFGLSSASDVSTQRTFVGLNAATSTFSNADPSSNKNLLGFCVDEGDSTWYFAHNDNTGQTTKDALTGTFPPRDQSISLFEARIFCPPNGSTIYYSLQVIGGSYYEGSTSSEIPTTSTFLSPIIWTNNGSTASSVGIDVVMQYIETF